MEISRAHCRRLARHLLTLAAPQSTKILSRLPTEDKVRVLEELERLKEDAPKND